jgi:hypothetical protein
MTNKSPPHGDERDDQNGPYEVGHCHYTTTISGAWLQAGLNKDNPEDYAKMVRILRKLVERDAEETTSSSNRAMIIIGAIGAAGGTIIATLFGFIPEVYRWLITLRHP